MSGMSTADSEGGLDHSTVCRGGKEGENVSVGWRRDLMRSRDSDVNGLGTEDSLRANGTRIVSLGMPIWRISLKICRAEEQQLQVKWL